MLKLKLQYFGYLMQRTDSFEKTQKGMTEDEMVGWHYQLNGHEFESALGVGDGQGSLATAVQFSSVQFSRSVVSDSLQPP